MSHWIDRMAARRRTTICVALVFYVLNVVLHDKVQALALATIELLSLRRANLLAAGIALVVFLATVPWFVSHLRLGPRPLFKGLYAVVTLALVLASYAWLFAVNSEALHFLQYAVLALLVFPLVGRFGETLIWVSLLGALDEAYQYWVLHRGWLVYYDFNDVVLNLLGAAIGVLTVAVVTRSGPAPPDRSTYSLRTFLVSPAFLAIVVVASFVALLFVTGRMTIYKDPDLGPWFVLRRLGPPVAFWSRPEWGRAYHVMTPAEATGILAALTAFYVGLDFRLERPTLNKTPS